MASWRDARKQLQKFVATAGLYLALGVWVVVGVISFLVHFHLIPENINVFPVEQMPALALVTGLFWILSEQAKDAEEEAKRLWLSSREGCNASAIRSRTWSRTSPPSSAFSIAWRSSRRT
jgi:hypothetical protein